MRYDAGIIEEINSSRTEVLERAKNVMLFTVLTAMGAKVFIPHEPVPFTLQTLFVVLAGAFLGGRAATVSMSTYLLLGAAGLPVFAGLEAGPEVFVGPTAGYLLGFLVSAAVVGSIINKNTSLSWTIFSMLTGFAVIFACGTIWLDAFYLHSLDASIVQGFLIFSFWDLVKLAAAVAVYRAFKIRTDFRTSPSIHLNHKSEAQNPEGRGEFPRRS